MPIPWDKVIQHGPQVLDAAKSLYSKWQLRPKQEEINPGLAPQTQLDRLLARVQALEEAEEKRAALMTQMAEQNQALSTGISALKIELETLENAIEENRRAQTLINHHSDEITKQLQQSIAASATLEKKNSLLMAISLVALALSSAALIMILIK
jgi:predicted transcriptional regulator